MRKSDDELVIRPRPVTTTEIASAMLKDMGRRIEGDVFDFSPQRKADAVRQSVLGPPKFAPLVPVKLDLRAKE